MILKSDGVGDAHRIERYRAKTDLFYLGTEYLGYDLVESVHKPVCDFFVRKDPDKPFDQWDRIKDRLLLDPREHYKTTIDVIDMIQSIICFPDIRIAVFSGAEDLAKQIMLMAQRHFQLNDKFKELFFEHAVAEGKTLPVFEFTTPARTNWRLREPTITISTILSVSTGGHFEEIRYDDIVTPQNSETVDQLEKTKDRVKATIPLVVAGGYRYFIGTRYDHSDVYGDIIDRMSGEAKAVEKIPFGSITITESWKIFQRSACSLPFNKESSVLFTENALKKSQFNYRELHKRLAEMGQRHFGCQYLNDPLWGEVASFSEELMRSILVPTAAIPLLKRDYLNNQLYKGGKVFIAWDLAFSEKKTANRTVGVAGCFDPVGRLYILDMLAGRFSPDELVLKFFSLFMKWRHFMGRVAIEDAAGSKLIGPSLRSSAQLQNIHLPIDWTPTRPDRVKQERIFGLLPLMKSGKLFINKDLPQLEDLIKEFTRFPRFWLDDIPDACSMLLDYQGFVDFGSFRPTPPEEIQAFEPNPLGYGLVS